MHFVIRSADPTTATRYPLPVSSSLQWQQVQTNSSTNQASGHDSTAGEPFCTWQCQLNLPEIPAEHIVVPSFASTTEHHAHQFNFHSDQAHSHLQKVPAKDKTEAAYSNAVKSLSTHIDCWHTHERQTNVTLTLQVYGDEQPKDYLVTVSTRPLQQPIEQEQLQDLPSLSVSVPGAIAQMQADANIASRICSPTALAMALSVQAHVPDWQATIQACYDPVSRAYGAWPLAIRWAAKNATLGAVEVLSDWQQAATVLAAGTPIVASIRFEKENLKGAPLSSTGGHLVLCYGIDGDQVLVKDPAANQHAEVDRRYNLQEFTLAWLHRRGAAYIFCSPQTS